LSPQGSNDKLYFMVKSYYKEAYFEVPEDYEKREFAIQTFDGKMIRHMAVNDLEEMRKTILSKGAIDVYLSTASYENPDAPSMDSKGWLRADLQFDIDVDHFEDCKPKLKICDDQLVPIEEECEGKPLQLVTKECLMKGFYLAKKLVHILEKYFAISKEMVEIHFSGNRGFHVIARNTPYDESGSDLRREMADFILGNQLKKENFCLKKDCIIPMPDDPGWRGRVGEELERLLPHQVQLWGQVENAEELLERAIESAKIDIDLQVTVDTSRLMRVPGSINRKSMLVVKKVWKSFKYDVNLSPFKDYEVLVKAKVNFELDVFYKRIKLRKGEIAELDGARGAFLAAKGLVDIVRYTLPKG